MTTPGTADPLADLHAARDSSLALAAGALARIADPGGRATFGELAVAYREDFLRLRQHTHGPSPEEAGSLSVDEARTHLGNSVLPRLAGLRIVVVPAGVLWSEAAVGFAGNVWDRLVAEPDRGVARLTHAAEQALARTEAVSGEHAAVRGGSRLAAQGLVKS